MPRQIRSPRPVLPLRGLTLLVIVSLLLAACGGSESQPTPTSAPQPTATTAASAATPTTVARVEASPTSAPVAPTAVVSRQISVDALWFTAEGGVPQGGVSTVKVQVRKKDEGDLRVGFFESEVSGTGQQWRTSGWMAVITSSLLLGNDPSLYEYSFDVAGRIDGPSAGALMTVAVLAGLRGDTVDPRMTMTGTINPDGTIGPISGIPNKLDGAAAKGKAVVLVPSGQRYDYDYRQKRAVDVVDYGKRLNVDVRLVSDIYDAYKQLTGKDLPRLTATGSRAAFPTRAFDKLRAGAITWISRYQQDRSRFTALPAKVQEYRKPTMDNADYYSREADKALASGQAGVAYENAMLAAANAKFAAQAAELDNLYYSQGVNPLIQRLNSASSAETRMSGVLERLKAEQPRTAADAIALMDAYSNLAVAQGLVAQAQGAIDKLLANKNATEDDALDAIYLAAYNYANADIFLDLSLDRVGLGFGFGKAPAPNQRVLRAMSETLRRGAEANIAYFESIVVNPWAQENGIHPDVAKYYFMQYDGDYLNAVAASAGGTKLAAGVGEPAQAASLTLGSALAAYSSSATVLAKYYSLGAQLDKNARVMSYDRQSILADMLDLADRHADELLRAVSSEEPVAGIYYYENARIFRQGTPSDQLYALNYYWQSAVLSQLLGVFSGTLKGS